MRYKYVPIDRIFSKFGRDVSKDFDEGDLVEWTGEALEFIGAPRYYEEAVAFIEVKNHQCTLPKWLHSIIQIGRDNRWTCKQDSVTPTQVLSCIPKITTSEGVQWSDGTIAPCPTKLQWSEELSQYILIDCDGSPKYDYELAYYRPYFDLRMEYDLWLGSPIRNRYTPVRLATSALYDSIVCRERDNGNSVGYGPDTYTIIRHSVLRFSFEKGMVAVAYNRQVVDDKTGYPLIPDNISYTTAITKYITMMMVGKDYNAYREGSDGRYKTAQADWDWYCGQASNVDKVLFGVDEHQNFLEQRQYLIPNNNKYYGFFGNLATPENRRFNDPNQRNGRSHYLS